VSRSTTYTVYILRNFENKLYIGQTKNLKERLIRHADKQGARFVKVNMNFRLVYSEKHPSLQVAMKREKQLKGWTRARKEALIEGNLALLKRL
jgi:putative endonuclease